MSHNGEKSQLRKQPTVSHIFLLPMLVLLSTFCLNADIHAQQTFKLSVTSDFATSREGFEFRNVEVASTSGIAAAKDVTVWCHVQLQGGNTKRNITLVQPIPITLKAGQALIERDLYLPSNFYGAKTIFSLDSDPRNVYKQLTNFQNSVSSIGDDALVIKASQSNSQAVVRFETVFDHQRFQPQSRLKNIIPNSQNFYSYLIPSVGQFFASRMNWSIDLLPKRWIGYSCVEQVVIDSDRLIELSQDSERFDALIQWVAMGGSLFVWDCKNDFRTLPEVMRVISKKRSASIVNLPFFHPTDRLLRNQAIFLKKVADLKQQSTKNSRFRALGNETSGENFPLNWERAFANKRAAGGFEFDTDSDVLLHRLGKGKIFFQSTAFKENSTSQRLTMRFLCCGSGSFQMLNSMGDESLVGRPYKKWQLIDVGIAPTGLFVFVVVGFMLLIGPVGYSYLKVKLKLHYQIWLVPLISAAACLTLLGYAFLSEGVGTKLRPTVFVELDQSRGMASTYGWYSVYSALQPRPYQFRDDQFASLEQDLLASPAVYRWASDGYQLSGGYASARNVHQVFAATPIKTDSRIDVVQVDGENSIKLTNRLKDEVDLLVVKVGGECYFAQNLGSEDSQLVSPITGGVLSKIPALKKFFRELLPSNSQDYRLAKRRSYNGYSNRGGRVNTFGLQNNFAADQVIAFSTPLGIQQNLEDGHYIAILDSMSEVPSVVPGAREIDGKVFVHGKW